jgi:hypothetical protein
MLSLVRTKNNPVFREIFLVSGKFLLVERENLENFQGRIIANKLATLPKKMRAVKRTANSPHAIFSLP